MAIAISIYFSCNMRFQNTCGLYKYELTCGVKNGTAYCTIWRKANLPVRKRHKIPDKPNKCYKSTMHTENKTTSPFMDIPTIDSGIDDAFTITSQHLNEGIYSNPSAHCGILIADNENNDNPFTIFKQTNTGIVLTTSAFRTITYKEDIGQEVGAYVPLNKKMKDTHDQNKDNI